MTQIYTLLFLLALGVTTGYADLQLTLHFFSPWGTTPHIIRTSTSYTNDFKDTVMVKNPDHCGWYTYTQSDANAFNSIRFTDGNGNFLGTEGLTTIASTLLNANGTIDKKVLDDHVTPFNLRTDGGHHWGFHDYITATSFDAFAYYDIASKTMTMEESIENTGLNGPCKTVHIFSPWKKLAPIALLSSGTSTALTAEPDECGWYTLELPSNGVAHELSLTNRDGDTYGRTGKDDNETIDLKSHLKNNNHTYLTFEEDEEPTINSKRPNTEDGYCLLAQLKGVIYDWDAGDFGAFQPGTDACPNDITKGLAADKLGDDNLPLPGPNASSCHADSITNWFQAKESNRTCVDLQLSPNSEGIYQFSQTVDVNDHSGLNGFYPLDNFSHDNNSLTNNKGLTDSNGDDVKHNYHFCMHIATSFTYKEGQHFEFEGDDDMWIYLNGSLVLDIGGIHSPLAGSLNIDDHLNTGDIGESQDFRIFYCERQTDQSNLKIQTDIDFDPPRYYHNELDSSSKNRQTNNYTIHEGYIQRSGGCSPDETSIQKESDFFWSTDTTIDADDIPLEAGESHFENGIIIDDNQYQFTIDLLAIQEATDIKEGTYYLIHRSQSTSSEEQGYIEVQVTNYDYFLQLVEPWSPEDELSSAPIEIGLLEQYDFMVKIFEVTKEESGNDTILCESCEGSFSFEGSSLFDISNENFEEGLFQFSIFSDEPIKEEEITITFDPDGSAEYPHNKRVNSIETPEITVLDYPNFLPDKHGNRYIDKNSDGTMDRIELTFKTAPSDSVLDNLDITFTWPNSDSIPLRPKKNELKPLNGDPYTIYWDIPTERYTIHPLLTHITDSAQESALIKYKHPKTGESLEHVIEMTDAMPPVLVTAELIRGSKGDLDTLIVHVTEPLEEDDLYKDGNKGYTATHKKDDDETITSEANRITNDNAPFPVHRIVFDNSNDNSVAVGDFLTFYDHEDNIRDLEGNNPGDSAQSVVVQSITPENLSIRDFYEITDALLETYSPEDSLTAVPITQSELDDTDQAGVILGSNMKEVLWHFMDPYDWADNDPKHYSYHYTITLYNTLGNYINTHHGSVTCNDSDAFGGDCLESSPEDPKAFALFIPPYAYNNRVLATGVYIARASGYYRYTNDDTTIQTAPFKTLFKLGVSRIKDRE
ncbi:MAG: fibro-slime domain-containing protein [Fibrobacterales bacterium]